MSNAAGRGVQVIAEGWPIKMKQYLIFRLIEKSAVLALCSALISRQEIQADWGPETFNTSQRE